MFGLHLTLDCYECNKKNIDSLEKVYGLLNELPQLIKMKKISRPSVIRYEGKGWDKGGITGMVFLATSHISIHTFPANRFFSMDVYSCKPFDAEKAAAFITEKMGAKVVEKELIKRGSAFKRLN